VRSKISEPRLRKSREIIREMKNPKRGAGQILKQDGKRIAGLRDVTA
jgi:hypothetical protein